MSEVDQIFTTAKNALIVGCGLDGGWGAGVRVGPGYGHGWGSGRWCCGWTGKVCVFVDSGGGNVNEARFITAGDVADPFHVLGHTGVDPWDVGLSAAVTKTHDSNRGPAWTNLCHQSTPWVSLWKETNNSCWDSFFLCCLGGNSLKLTRWWLRCFSSTPWTVMSFIFKWDRV